MTALILPVGPDKIKFVLGKIKNKYQKKRKHIIFKLRTLF